ncbi:MAG: hypothetical protein ACR2P7_08885 [bacterium]
MPKKESESSADKLLGLMRDSGKSIIDRTATTDLFAKHIEEIGAAGYDGEIHANFRDYLKENFSLATGDKIRWIGEIIVDLVVLETARFLTENSKLGDDYFYNSSEAAFLASLPFQPPEFHLKEQSYTEISGTFRELRLGHVENLILQGKYDDIFDAILLWRTYFKEPFHDHRRSSNIRSVDDYLHYYLLGNINNHSFKYALIQTISNSWTRGTERFYMDADSCAEVAVRFFSKKENLKRFFHSQKEILLDQKCTSSRIKETLLKEEQAIKDAVEQEKKEKTKQHEQSRRKKLDEPAMGQKKREIIVEMLNNETFKSGTAVGNHAAWLCPCGNKSPLIGRTRGIQPTIDTVVICAKCEKHYFLPPMDGEPNKPPEKITEIQADCY